jgi:hypothetical protein
MENIRVIVRVRPPTTGEAAAADCTQAVHLTGPTDPDADADAAAADGGRAPPPGGAPLHGLRVDGRNGKIFECAFDTVSVVVAIIRAVDRPRGGRGRGSRSPPS